MDDVTWGILAIALTGAGGAATWWKFKEHGPVEGARALGWTLLVPAAWLTGILALLARITAAFTTWASRLVFSPTFWIGVVVGGVGLALIAITGLMARRGLEVRASDSPVAGPAAPGRGAPTARPAVKAAKKAGRAPRAVSEDDEFGDIESLLRKRGIE